MTAVTFDTFRKTNQTLSGSNLVATSSGAGWVGSSKPGQDNFYAEFTLTTLTGTPQVGIAALTAASATNPQTFTSGLGYDTSGAVKYNSTTLATIATFAGGNRIDMAVNLRYRLIWFRVNGGNWNNNAANDPATLTGGIDFSGMTTIGSIQTLVYASLTGTVWTAAFSSGSWVGTAPAGYSSMDAVVTLADGAAIDARMFGLVSRDAVGSNGLFVAEPLPRNDIYKFFSPGGVVTVVSGFVQELGVNKAGCPVEVYDRISGELIGRVLSDGSGAWSVPCLGRPAVRVVASDPTTFNSLVYDNVVPY